MVTWLENDVGTYGLLHAATDQRTQEGSCVGKGQFNQINNMVAKNNEE